jgi:hypothetical protein
LTPAAQPESTTPATEKNASLQLPPLVPGLHVGDPPAEFVDRDDAPVDERLGDRMNPAFVVGHGVVRLGAEGLDVPPELVHGHPPAVLLREQNEQGVHPLLPREVVVLGLGDRPGREAAEVMGAAGSGGEVGHDESHLVLNDPAPSLECFHVISGECEPLAIQPLIRKSTMPVGLLQAGHRFR